MRVFLAKNGGELRFSGLYSALRGMTLVGKVFNTALVIVGRGVGRVASSNAHPLPTMICAVGSAHPTMLCFIMCKLC